MRREKLRAVVRDEVRFELIRRRVRDLAEQIEKRPVVGAGKVGIISQTNHGPSLSDSPVESAADLLLGELRSLAGRLVDLGGEQLDGIPDGGDLAATVRAQAVVGVGLALRELLADAADVVDGGHGESPSVGAWAGATAAGVDPIVGVAPDRDESPSGASGAVTSTGHDGVTIKLHRAADDFSDMWYFASRDDARGVRDELSRFLDGGAR